MMRVKLTIDVESVPDNKRSAVYMSNNDCYLARALKGVLKPEYVPSIGGGTMDICRNNRIVYFRDIPTRLADKLASITDTSGPTKNFTATISLPKKYLKLEAVCVS